MTDVNLFNEIKSAVSKGASCKIARVEYAKALEEELNEANIPHSSIFCAGEREVVFIVQSAYESEFIAAQARAFSSSCQLPPLALFESAKAIGYKNLMSIDVAGGKANAEVSEAGIDYVCNTLRKAQCLFSRVGSNVYVHPECMFSKTGNDFAYFCLLSGLHLSPYIFSFSIRKNTWDEEITDLFLGMQTKLVTESSPKSVVLAGLTKKGSEYAPSNTYLEGTRKGIYRMDKKGSRYERSLLCSIENNTMTVYELRGIVRFLMAHAIKGADKFCIPGSNWEDYLRGGDITEVAFKRPKLSDEEERVITQAQLMIGAVNREATFVTLTKYPDFRISDPESCENAFNYKVQVMRSLLETRGLPEIESFANGTERFSAKEREEILDTITEFLPRKGEPLEVERSGISFWLDTKKKMTPELKSEFVEIEQSRGEGSLEIEAEE